MVEFSRLFALGFAAVLSYGVTRAFVCVLVSLAYFTVAHVPPYGVESRIALALVWGTQAMWIEGLFLGAACACGARLGPWTKLTARELIVPTFTLSLIFLAGTLLSGFFAYASAASSLTTLAEPWASHIPAAEHPRFLFVLKVLGANSGPNPGHWMLMAFLLVLQRASRDQATGVTAARLARKNP